MLKIKLSRTGKKGQPHYKVVIAEARRKRDGKQLETIGFYNPLTQPATFTLNQQRYQYWLSKGAQPTDTVRKLATNKQI